MHFTVDTDLAVAGIVLGLAAIIMAVPPLCQMLWGRPKLTFEFVEYIESDSKHLICTIKNRPVENRFHRFMRVSRDSGEVDASITLTEIGTGKLIIPHLPVLLHDSASLKQDPVVSCRPHHSVMFHVIRCSKSGPVIYDLREDIEIPIADGTYGAAFLIICGDRHHIVRKTIQVNSDPGKTFWY